MQGYTWTIIVYRNVVTAIPLLSGPYHQRPPPGQRQVLQDTSSQPYERPPSLVSSSDHAKYEEDALDDRGVIVQTTIV